MIFRRAVPAAISLSIAFAAAASAQTAPPLKMGLWQHQITVQMSGMPDGMPASRTITKQSCFTPDTWRNSLQQMQSHPAMPGVSCTNSNVQQDARHVSFDAQCTMQQGMSMNVHVDMHFDSEEAMHGTTSVTMTGDKMPSGMTVNSTIQSKFVNTDCGSVKPDDQKDVTPSGPPPS
jgi:hypothetical protein